jgi:hypothetical protein
MSTNVKLKRFDRHLKCFVTPTPAAPTPTDLTPVDVTLDTLAMVSQIVPDAPTLTSVLTIHTTVMPMPLVLTPMAASPVLVTSAGKETVTPVPTSTNALFPHFATLLTTATPTPDVSTLMDHLPVAATPDTLEMELLAPTLTNVQTAKTTIATLMLLARTTKVHLLVLVTAATVVTARHVPMLTNAILISTTAMLTPLVPTK